MAAAASKVVTPAATHASMTRVGTCRRRALAHIVLCVALSTTFFVVAAETALGATSACSRDMKRLLSDIKRPDAGTHGLTRAIVVRSLSACSTPGEWRAEAGHVRIAAALAPLLHAKDLETDRTLDRLCSVFDAYENTNVCKHHLTS